MASKDAPQCCDAIEDTLANTESSVLLTESAASPSITWLGIGEGMFEHMPYDARWVMVYAGAPDGMRQAVEAGREKYPKASAWLSTAERTASGLDTHDVHEGEHNTDDVVKAARAMEKFVATELSACNDRYRQLHAKLRGAIHQSNAFRAMRYARWRALHDLVKLRGATPRPSKAEINAVVEASLADIEADLTRAPQ